MHEASRYQAIDLLGNVHRQDSGDRLSVVGHDQMVASCDRSEIATQVLAKIPNVDLHCPRLPSWLNQ